MTPRTLSGRVRYARKCKGFSAARVDAIAGLTRGHTNAIESGRKPNPEAATASKLARALGVDLTWLIDGTGERPRKSRKSDANDNDISTKPAA